MLERHPGVEINIAGAVLQVCRYLTCEQEIDMYRLVIQV